MKTTDPSLLDGKTESYLEQAGIGDLVREWLSLERPARGLFGGKARARRDQIRSTLPYAIAHVIQSFEPVAREYDEHAVQKRQLLDARKTQPVVTRPPEMKDLEKVTLALMRQRVTVPGNRAQTQANMIREIRTIGEALEIVQLLERQRGLLDTRTQDSGQVSPTLLSSEYQYQMKSWQEINALHQKVRTHQEEENFLRKRLATSLRPGKITQRQIELEQLIAAGSRIKLQSAEARAKFERDVLPGIAVDIVQHAVRIAALQQPELIRALQRAADSLPVMQLSTQLRQLYGPNVDYVQLLSAGFEKYIPRIYRKDAGTRRSKRSPKTNQIHPTW